MKEMEALKELFDNLQKEVAPSISSLSVWVNRDKGYFGFVHFGDNDCHMFHNDISFKEILKSKKRNGILYRNFRGLV